MSSQAPHSRSSRNTPAAFTLVDLLVMLAVLAVSVTLLSPVLARTQPNSKSFQCLNNHRQLCRAWRMYADDNNDWLLCASSNVKWVNGDMSVGTDTTNINLLLSSRLKSYLGDNYKVYKCPGDTTTYLGNPRVRSVSMNGFIGQNFWASQYNAFLKLSQMTRPGPVNTFVTLDECAGLTDGFFYELMAGYDPQNPSQFALGDVPAAYHNTAGSFSFADGHSELHKWRDTRTVAAGQQSPVPSSTPSPDNPDVDWLMSKATYKITGGTR